MPPRKRRQPSKVDLLPAPLREAVVALHQSGRYTLEQIASHLADLAAGRRSMLPPELDIPVSITPESAPSKSSLGRYVKGLDAIAEKLQRSRAVAEALVAKLGDEPESRTARLNIELMHGVVMDIVMAAEDAAAKAAGGGQDGGGDGGGGAGAPAGVVIDPEAAMMLARALKDLASAKKADADLILKLKGELAKEMAAKLDEEAKTNRGLDAPTVARLKAGFLGIKG